MNLDGFTIVLGVLGAYFAILLVLSGPSRVMNMG